MFGIGLPEIIVILAVALVVVGPDKLPELARSLAKGINELKGSMNQLKENFSEESKVINSVQEDLKKTANQLSADILAEKPQVWQEDDIAANETDSKTGTDQQSGEERPWEKDAKTDPQTPPASDMAREDKIARQDQETPAPEHEAQPSEITEPEPPASTTA